MSRDAARKIGRSPNADHVLVKRDSTGTVQTSAALSSTGNTATGTTTVSPASTVLSDPNLVAFTSASVSVSGGGAGNTATGKILRNGTVTVAQTSSTGAATTAVSNTHTTPLNSPTYTLQLAANGGTATVTGTVSREDRWV